MAKKIKDQKVGDFLEAIASTKPVPGGGSASALAGAIAASLLVMVTGLTIGKEKYQEVEARVSKLAKEAEKLLAELLDLADQDAKAYLEVVEAYRLPKDSDTSSYRGEEIQKAYKTAAAVPLKTAQKSLKVLIMAAWLAENGNKFARSDALVAIELAQAAIYGALENVRINLPYIEDKQFTADLEKKIDQVSSGAKKLVRL